MIGRPKDHSSKLARGELSDSEAAERLEAEHPDAFMRRRDFLARAAALAGTASLASVLPADTLVAEAARHGPAHPAQPQQRADQHLRGADDGEPLLRPLLRLVSERRRQERGAPLPGRQRPPGRHPSPDLRLSGLRLSRPRPLLGRGPPPVRQGQDGRLRAGKRGRHRQRRVRRRLLPEEDIPFLPYAAQAYTLYDRWFCSIMDSTYPNRHYQWGAQDGGTMGNKLPPQTPQDGYTWETIFDRAKAHHLTARYYASDVPFAALYGQRGLGWTHPVSQFYDDAAAGKLPNIAFVDPAFLGEDQGTSGDEHPHGDIRLGQAFMSDVVHAFISRRNTGAARCSSTTTSGEGSSITSSRASSPTVARTRNIDKSWG